MNRFKVGTAKKRLRENAFILTSVIACAQSMAAAQSPQQDTVPSSAVGTADIVVTAQRRAESIQDTPITMSAFGSQQLERASASTLENLSLLVPSVSIGNVEGRVQTSIRGIGVVGVFDIAESAVATHIDGFYVARLSGPVGSFLDLERVEVLKGPQGTLYGRNATGGAINIITKKPTDKFELSAMAEGTILDGNGSKGGADRNAGTGYGIKASAVVNVPIATNVNARVAAMKVNRDGSQTAFYPNGDKIDIQDADQIYLRAQLSVDLTPDLNWLIATDNFWADDRGSTVVYSERGRPDVPVSGEGPTTPIGGKSRRVYTDQPIGNKPSTNAFTSTLSWNANDVVTLRSLTQYRYTKYQTMGDIDGTAAPLSSYSVRQSSKAYSQEFQANLDLGQLKATTGLFYFQEKAPIAQVYNLGILGPGGHVDVGGVNMTKAYAGYADLTYSMTDELDLIVGGRYSIEKKGGQSTALLEFPGTSIANDVELPTKTFKAFTPKAVINYKPTPDITVFASVQKGFKSGGYNLGDLTNNPSYDPEKIVAYEIGAKTRWFDRRLALNPSVFYYDYKDLQVEDVITIGGGAGTVAFRNAATARVWGIELDGYAVPAAGLRFDFSVAYLNAKFRSGSLTNPIYQELGPVDITGLRLPKSPKLSLTGALTYEYRTANDYTIVPNFTASYRSKQYYTTFNDPTATQDGYWWLRASLAYGAPDDRWTISLFADNITNKLAYTFAKPSSAATGYALQTSITTPRTFGVRLDWKM